jgi:hypothetical protein
VTLTVGASTFSVTSAGGSLVATRQGEGFAISYVRGSTSKAMQAAPTGVGAASLGALPIDLSGSWKVAPADGQDAFGCVTALSPPQVSAQCQQVGSLPPYLPNPRLASATGSRTTQLASIFGDLGGEWALSSSGGGTCTVRFEGSTFTSDCANAGTLGGQLQVSFNGNTASGSSSKGLEFSAQRL